MDEKAGKGMQTFQMDGKGVYVGEISRSMYSRGEEHQKDKEDRAEESHQVKHWLLEHPEMEDPPYVQVQDCFHFQRSTDKTESVRIKRRGPAIRNSKSEYSRCKVRTTSIHGGVERQG